MNRPARFTRPVLEAINKSRVIGIRAGRRHRFIAVWAVVVEGRVFVRSWNVKPEGWYPAFLKERGGAIQIGGREMPVRTVRTRSERLKSLVDGAYGEKYRTPASRKYVRDFKRPRCRETTTELVPVARNDRGL